MRTEIVRILQEYGPLTLPELSRMLGASKSWTWKLLKRLSEEGVVRVERRGGVLVAAATPLSYREVMRVGILRASEYPYIVPFLDRLSHRYRKVEVVVYDEAFKLSYDIALGKIHLGMAPAISHIVTHRLTGGLVKIVGGGSGGGMGIIDSGTGDEHVTTMTSSMELCAEVRALPGPRVYARSGDEILRLVARGTVRYGVVWQPYLEIARAQGLRVEPCNLPFCCLLWANTSLDAEFDYIKKAFSDSVSEARNRLDDPGLIEKYSRIIGLQPGIVRVTVKSYTFHEEPPVDEVSALFNVIRRVALPEWTLRNVFA